MAMLLHQIAGLHNGVKTLAVIQNGFGQQAVDAMCQHFLSSDAINSMTKLIIKDPTNQGFAFGNTPLTKCLNEKSYMLFRLKHLVLQNVGLVKRDVIQLAEITTSVQSLRNLNISGNNLQPADFIAMFEIMKPQSYSITNLNISWNSANTNSNET